MEVTKDGQCRRASIKSQHVSHDAVIDTTWWEVLGPLPNRQGEVHKAGQGQRDHNESEHRHVLTQRHRGRYDFSWNLGVASVL